MRKLMSILACFLLLLTSCRKYLDQVPDDKLTLDQTFNNWSNASQFLNHVYSAVPDEYGQRDAGGDRNAGVWTCASDEANLTWPDRIANNINIGNYDASTWIVHDYWANWYKGIRAATIFIQNADKISDINQEKKAQYKAEARALRAMYYFYLMRIYGPVVIMGETVPAADAKLELPRNTYDECTNYVVSELEKAAKDLPLTSTEGDKGRITKPVALAFKANALLYAASPLFNGNTKLANLKNQDGTSLINQTLDPGKWRKAADAYKAFLNEFVPGLFDLNRNYNSNGSLDPYLSCKNAVIKDWNKEAVFTRVECSIGPWQYALTPFHDGQNNRDVKGGSAINPTQAMVDAFFMENGRSITDAASGYQASGFTNYQAPGSPASVPTFNQWVNREPRFYVNITYNGSIWLNTTTNGHIITQTNYNGNSGRSRTSNDYSSTGYIARKAMGFDNWDINNRTLILIRLAEIYLSYAESLNEIDYSANQAEILKYVNLIRERAGIPQYGAGANALPVPGSQSEMREAIRKERRVELAFENQRYFDVRRWIIADQTEGGPFYGMDINARVDENFYNKVVFETRVFTGANCKSYFFPLPTGDVLNDPKLVQNLGW